MRTPSVIGDSLKWNEILPDSWLLMSELLEKQMFVSPESWMNGGD